MAIGLDDALTLAVAAVKIGETLVAVVERHRRHHDPDVVRLLDDVRATAGERIRNAEDALFRFERVLKERGVDLELNLNDIIRKTSALHWFEHHQLSEIRRQFNQFSESIASATDDIAALARCRETMQIGEAAVTSLGAKAAFQERLNAALSLNDQIELLRAQLAHQRAALA